MATVSASSCAARVSPLHTDPNDCIPDDEPAAPAMFSPERLDALVNKVQTACAGPEYVESVVQTVTRGLRANHGCYYDGRCARSAWPVVEEILKKANLCTRFTKDEFGVVHFSVFIQ
jgi:hypothetical protein